MEDEDLSYGTKETEVDNPNIIPVESKDLTIAGNADCLPQAVMFNNTKGNREQLAVPADFPYPALFINGTYEPQSYLVLGDIANRAFRVAIRPLYSYYQSEFRVRIVPIYEGADVLNVPEEFPRLPFVGKKSSHVRISKVFTDEVDTKGVRKDESMERTLTRFFSDSHIATIEKLYSCFGNTEWIVPLDGLYAYLQTYVAQNCVDHFKQSHAGKNDETPMVSDEPEFADNGQGPDDDEY
jgi:hypothetical protein